MSGSLVGGGGGEGGLSLWRYSLKSGVFQLTFNIVIFSPQLPDQSYLST